MHEFDYLSIRIICITVGGDWLRIIYKQQILNSSVRRQADSLFVFLKTRKYLKVFFEKTKDV